MQKNQIRRAHAVTLTTLLFVTLGCQQAPVIGNVAQLSTSPAGPAAPAVDAGNVMEHDVTVSVDPIHGAATELPGRSLQTVSVTGTLKLLVSFSNVVHDASTGRTTVTMQLNNAGDSLTYLKCTVSGDRKVVTPAWPFNTTAAAANSTQTVDLTFDNPSGGDFNINLAFTGTLARNATVVPGGTAAPSTAPTATPTAGPTATPTAGPTATPTPAPTATPTAAPTAAPTTPAAGSGWTATASSTYGTLTPGNAIDGNGASQWASAEYQGAQATWTLDTGASQALSSIGIKAQPPVGNASYMIETSNDGSSFQPVAGPFRNSTWNMEAKSLPAGTNARFVRLHFTNDPAHPDTRFSIFEVNVNGQGAPSGSGTATPTPAPSATATPTPMPTPTGSTGPLQAYSNNFEQYGVNSQPSDFVDPNDEGYSYSWMPRVDWHIVSLNGSKQFEHNGLSNTANLSFRRYRGNGVGLPNGALPNHYNVGIDVTPLQSYTYSPTGDQGTQVYYVDPTHYFEVLIKPTYFQVWACDNAPPFQSNGWHMLYQEDVKTNAGQSRRLGAEVDVTNHTIKAYLDGVLKTTIGPNASGVMTSLLSPTGGHYLALRGTGNIVAHDNLTIQPM